MSPDGPHSAEESCRAYRELLTRIRQWDALNPPNGEAPSYPWGDAAFWRKEIDAALGKFA